MLCGRKTVCLFAALLVLSAPVIACALPGEEMTKAEQDCCLQMGDQCGSSQMSDAHTCCTKTPHVAGNVLKATGKYAPVAPETISHAAFCTLPALAAAVFSRPQDTPAGSPSPPGSITILRI